MGDRGELSTARRAASLSFEKILNGSVHDRRNEDAERFRGTGHGSRVRVVTSQKTVLRCSVQGLNY
jgi:hypothetical protein